jgi:hypothetical protein
MKSGGSISNMDRKVKCQHGTAADVEERAKDRTVDRRCVLHKQQRIITPFHKSSQRVKHGETAGISAEFAKKLVLSK